MSDTLQFDRVLVIDKGHIAEDDNPQKLYADEESRYRLLCDAEDLVRKHLWASAHWRRLRVVNGQLAEQPDSHDEKPAKGFTWQPK